MPSFIHPTNTKGEPLGTRTYGLGFSHFPLRLLPTCLPVPSLSRAVCLPVLQVLPLCLALNRELPQPNLPCPSIAQTWLFSFIFNFKEATNMSFYQKSKMCLLGGEHRAQLQGWGRSLHTPAGSLPLRQGPSHFLHLRTPSSSTSQLSGPQARTQEP